MLVRVGRFIGRGGAGFVATPRIHLSGLTIAEDAEVGTVVGYLSVLNSSVAWSFDFGDGGNPDSLFSIGEPEPFGSELVVNGTFDENIDGWSQAEGSDVVISHDDGKLKMVRATGSITAFPYQAFPTVPGRTYQLVFDISTATVAYRLGTALHGNQYSGSQISAGNSADIEFVATSKRAYLNFWPQNESATAEIDNISLRELRAPLKVAAPLDHETNPSPQVVPEATPSEGDPISRTFTIQVTA